MTTIPAETTPTAPKKHYGTHVALGALVIGIGALLFYADALRAWSTAGDECLKFAAESNTTIALNTEFGRQAVRRRPVAKGPLCRRRDGAERGRQERLLPVAPLRRRRRPNPDPRRL